MLKGFFTNRAFPFWFFHVPIFPYYLYLSIRRRSLAFFTNTNPNIFTGGFVNSSKINAFKGIDSKWLPKQAFFTSNLIDVVENELRHKCIEYPFILKPDKGERGFGVVKVNNREELLEKLHKVTDDFIIQEFIDFPLEFGILFYQNPKTNKGDISSICYKEMPFVIGNGVDELQELIFKKYNTLDFENINNQNSKKVLDENDHFLLEYIAHRNRSCLFKDYNSIYSNQIIETFSLITSKMENFNFGRFDVKAKTIESLTTGNDLKILEVNGVNSLPIHIFDPIHSFYKCYKDLYAHWFTIFQISKRNSSLGFKPMKTNDLIKEIRKKLS